MKRSEILAELRKGVPGQADYGQIDYSRLARFDGICALKQADAMADRNKPSVKLLKNVRLGLEEW